MFKTLLIKEWRERVPLAALGLGVMTLFLAAFLSSGNNQDLRELIPATFLIFFFPFIGVMLGAGAFESEFRNGSWAYLLSRPVRKETIWLAKLTALLSILAAFWLIFIGLMTAVPGLGDVVRGFNLPQFLDAGLEVFPLVLLSSVFYFSVAFCLSLLSERQLSLVFGSLFLGFAAQGLLSYFAFLAEGRGLLTRAGLFPGLDAYILALVLSSPAFLGASLIAFVKADFSQPKKKAMSVAKYSTLFLAAAWLASLAWTAVRPGPEARLESGIDVVGGEAVFSTTNGIYRYDISGDRVRKLTRGRLVYVSLARVRSGKLLYAEWPPDEDEELALRVMNTNGSGKKLLLGGGQDGPFVLDWAYGFDLSPDGKTAVFVNEDVEGLRGSRTYKTSIWSVRTDGTGFKRLPPFDPALAGNGKGRVWVRIMGWTASSDTLLLSARPHEGFLGSLWTYNMATGAQKRLLEGRRFSPRLVSPGGDSVFVVDRPEVKGPVEMFLLDVMSGERTPVMKIVSQAGLIWYERLFPVWSRTGDRIALLFEVSRGVYSVAVYSRPDRRLIEAENTPRGEPLPQEPSSLDPSIAWILGDTRIALGVPRERCVKVLGPDLAVEKKIPVPPGLGKDHRVWGAGDILLVQDPANDAIWRLDLHTEKWKKIW